MARPRLWVFAFIILFSIFSSNSAFAIIRMNVQFAFNDANQNGIINVGDRLSVTANFTLEQGDNIGTITKVECKIHTQTSGILTYGLSGPDGNNRFSTNIDFAPNLNVNYQNITKIVVEATTMNPVETADFTAIDLCPPQPNEVLVTGLTNFKVDPVNGSPIIRRDSTFKLSLKDTKGQLVPAGGTNGTSANVNLNPIGGVSQLLLTRTVNGSTHSFTSGTLFASQFNEIENDNLSLNYTITDNANPAVTGAFPNFRFDNKPPRPVDANTGFATTKTMLTFGDNIDVVAQVTDHGQGDWVKAEVKVGTNAAIVFNPMTPDGNTPTGGTATWRETIQSSAYPNFVGVITATFTFEDIAGNVVTVVKTINADFRQPQFTATIKNDANAPITNTINQNTRFYFDITYTGDYAPPAGTTITVNLGAIGLGTVTLNRNDKTFRTNIIAASECTVIENPSITFEYTINEGINAPITGDFGPIRFDNRPPNPVDDNTGFETNKAMLTFGDRINIIAQTNPYGVGDKVKADLTFTKTGGGTYTKPFNPMSFDGTPTTGGIANWRESIDSNTDNNFKGQAGTIAVKFTFEDEAGNKVEITKSIPVDFREPKYTAKIMNTGVNPNTEIEDVINRATNFCFELDFSEGDYEPPTNAVMFVDLDQIGLGNVSYVFAGEKKYRTQSVSAAACATLEANNVVFPYSIDDRINDPMVGNHRPITFDNKPPYPVSDNTGFDTTKDTLIYGDNIDVIAQVTDYGAGDVASVTLILTDTDDIVTSLNIPGMTLNGPAVVGTTVNWRDSIDPTLENAFKGKAGVLKAIFDFFDPAGNKASLSKTILVNFKLPEFEHASATVLLPDGSESPYKIATMSSLLSFDVKLKEMPTSGATVYINLSPILGPNDFELRHIGDNVFKGNFEVPEGQLDDILHGPFVFVATAVDGNGQTVAEDTTPAIAVDNLIPLFTFFAVHNTTPGKAETAPFIIGDSYKVIARVMNLEQGKVLADLTKIDISLPDAELTHDFDTTYSYSGVVKNCRDAGVVCDDSVAFELTAYDTVRITVDEVSSHIPGHHIKATTPPYKFDNEPPIIKNVGYSVKNAAGTPKDISDPDVWVKVDDKLTLFLEVASTTAQAYDGQIARLTNGSTYGISTTNFGVSDGKYVLEVTVPAVKSDLSYNNYVASFTYSVIDNDGNTAVDESFIATDTIYVKNFDQFPPDLDKVTFTTVPSSNVPGLIKKGDSVEFIVKIEGLDDIAKVEVNTAILDTDIPTLELTTTDTGSTKTYKGSIDAKDGSQAKNYQFEAYIYDIAANLSVKRDSIRYTIDCVAPEFVDGEHYFIIGKDNGDNPVSSIANVDDELWVIAKMTDYEDGAASATLYYEDAAGDLKYIATASLILDSTLNKHVGKFIVRQPGIANWPALDGSSAASLTYKLTSLDEHGNRGVMKTGYSSPQPDPHSGHNFVVRNVLPKIKVAGIALNPNENTKTLGDILVYNIGDKLIASGTLDEDAPISSAYLDLSAIPGCPAKFPLTKMFNDETTAGTFAALDGADVPIDLISLYGVNIDKREVDIKIHLVDMAGQMVSETKKLIIDTKRPVINKVTFDGRSLVVNSDEGIQGLDATNWKLIGSTTAGLEDFVDLAETTELVEEPVIDNATFSIRLQKEGRRKLVYWAHTPLYLAIPTDGYRDECGNGVAAVAYYPVTLTSTEWREPAKIKSVKLEQIFGTNYKDDKLKLTFEFSREMDFEPIADKEPSGTASHTELAIFTNTNLTDAQLRSAPSYGHFYVFQKNDKFEYDQVTESTLTVTFDANNAGDSTNASGTHWIARNLADPSKKLYIAHRYSDEKRRFIADEFQRPMKYHNVAERIEVTDNRSEFAVAARDIVVATKPNLDLNNLTLDLEFTEPVLLFKDAFTNNLAAPYSLVLPQTRNVPATEHSGKIKLYYDLGGSSFVTLTPSLDASNALASTTVRFNLNVNDVRNILTMYGANSSEPDWGLRLEPKAFYSIWSIGSNQYADFIEPVPGDADATPFEVTTEPVLRAVAISDPPPTKEDKGNLRLEFELAPNRIAGLEEVVYVPFDKTQAPEAGIFKMPSVGNYEHLATATFDAWGTRVVNGVTRDIAAFTVNRDFSGDPFDLTNGAIKLIKLKNILKHGYDEITETQVYDLSRRNISEETGFTTASEPLTLDNKAPEVVDFSHLATGIGLSPAQTGRYAFTFHETMDTAYTPEFYLATGTSRLYFTFVEWATTTAPNDTAIFKNNTAITGATLNGYWNYFVTNGRDLASNLSIPEEGQVLVKTKVPPVQEIKLYTKQETINPDIYVVDQPFNYDTLLGSKAELGLTYLTIPENLPHRIRFYNEDGNLLGETTVDHSGPNNKIATATFTNVQVPATALDTWPTVTIKAIDLLDNETLALTTIQYDNKTPDLSNFEIAGAASFTQDIYYSQSNGLDLSVFATLIADEPVSLAITNSINGTLATETISLNSLGAKQYAINFGRGYPDGDYQLYIYDKAGNLQAAPPALRLHIDNTPPEVLSIIPNTIIGNTPAQAATFTVTFTEPIDPRIAPTLTLATSSAVIGMQLIGWSDDYRVASFTNLNAIDATMPAGDFFYKASGGYDFSGNRLKLLENDPSFKLNVQAAGPVAHNDIVSYQSEVFGAEKVNNLAVNLGKNIAEYGSIAIELDYNGGRLNTPHELLIYNSDKELVKTLNVPDNEGNKVEVKIEEELADGTYSFRLKDNLDNEGAQLLNLLVVDSAAPVVSSFIFNDDKGSFVDGTYYFSQALSANGELSVTTTSDSLKAVTLNVNNNASFTSAISPVSTSHSISWPGLANIATGPYKVYLADEAGNLGVNGSDDLVSLDIMVDNENPMVTNTYICDENGVSTEENALGYTLRHEGFLAIEFSEPLNSSLTPEVKVATAPYPLSIIEYEFVRFLTAQKAIYRNKELIGENLIPGPYGVLIANGKDLAGNDLINVTHANPITTIDVRSQRPRFTARLESKQTDVYGNETLINYPFSPMVAPGIATLSLVYDLGHPLSTPHEIRVYDGNTVESAQIATIAVPLSNKVPVDSSFVDGLSPLKSVPFYFKVVDKLGGVSNFSPTSVVFDDVGPILSELTVSKEFYNPEKGAGITVYSTRDDGADDPLLLCFLNAEGIYKTHPLTPGSTNISTNISAAWLKDLPDNYYMLRVIDKAGNQGTAPAANITIDRLPPIIESVNAAPSPITSENANGVIITVVFNEEILGEPTLSLATSTQNIKIPCTFIDFTDPARKTARFSVGEIENHIPQGLYQCQIKASDKTGNYCDDSQMQVSILSRGPEILSIDFYSYQSTTASHSDEILNNRPFSFALTNKKLDIGVKFKSPPDMSETYYLNLYANGLKYRAPLATEVGNNLATYSWLPTGAPPEATNGTPWPNGLADTNGSYQVFVSDAKGASLYTKTWFVDNYKPALQGLYVNNGVADTENHTTYFNPNLQSPINIDVNGTDNSDLYVRLTKPGVSTDTYLLSRSGNSHSNQINGYHSRRVGTTQVPLPDGQYNIDVVDAAGNVADPLGGVQQKLVIDTAPPTVTDQQMYLVKGPSITNLANDAYYAPAAGLLTIKLNATTSKSDAYYVEIVRKNTNQVYRKLPIVAITGGLYTHGIQWDGKDENGNLAPSAAYTLRVTDFVGNKAVKADGSSITTGINLVTSSFVISNARQLASDSAVIYFNHPINDLNGLSNISYQHEADTTQTLATNLVKTSDTSVTFAPNASDGTFKTGSYQIQLSGITSIYNVEPETDTISLTADGDGPAIIGHSYTGINKDQPNKINLNFNESAQASSFSNKPEAFMLKANGATLEIASATYKSDTQVTLTMAQPLSQALTYQITAPGVRDVLGNLGSTTAYGFKGRDITPPVLKLSAFASPLNARDLIIIATTNEPLVANPTLQIIQNNSITQSLTMSKHPTNSSAYMITASIPSNRNNFGEIKVRGTDLESNPGESTISFFVGNIRASVASVISSDDNNLRLSFAPNSLSKDADLRIIERPLEKVGDAEQVIRSSLQTEYLTARGFRGSQLTPSTEDSSNAEELVPLSSAYEISIDSASINQGFDVALKASTATSTNGIGLFYQSGNSWKFVSGNKNLDNEYLARMRSTQVFAILKDIKAPVITFDEKIDFSQMFDTNRPEFRGRILDAGSGVNKSTLQAVFDDSLTQNFTLDDEGYFSFKALTPLEGGVHSIELRAQDNTGNAAVTPSLRFEVVKELKVEQIIQYPNPARSNYMNIRFITNRSDITEDNVKIRIYDVAGHRVKTLDTAPRRIGNTYDFRWDLCNGRGKRVANGVYFAKVEIVDPNDPGIKFKATLKLAVLR
jgi:flagellar hook assembly protein FlgD/methionine-rich copper-binding protein CopC